MVHVKKCPCEHGRGHPSTEFYIGGKPQIYCRGWIDKMTDELLDECRRCRDLAGGEQCEKDLAASRTCKSCKWFYEWFGVCCNGDSEWCADNPPFAYERSCDLWSLKTEEDADPFKKEQEGR